MALKKRDKVTYLKVSDGKLRQKTTKEDPEAEERFVELQNKYTYEKVYTECEGLLREIKQQEHEEYGVSYSMILVDPSNGESFSLQMGEDSRYFQAMVMHLPNVDFSKMLTVKPYLFKKDGKTNIGVTFLQDGEKVENYYKDWDEDDKKSTLKNGLEKFNFTKIKDDKDEVKILQVKVKKFLKEELKREVKRLMDYVEKHPLKISKSAPDHEEHVDHEETNQKSSKSGKSSKPEKSSKKGKKDAPDM